MDMKEFLPLIAYVLGFGVLWGRQDSSVAFLKKENDKRQAEISNVETAIAIDIAAIKHLFLTTDNEPKYVSYAAHDKLQASCHNLIMIRMDHIKGEQAQIKEGQARIEKLILSRTDSTGF